MSDAEQEEDRDGTPNRSTLVGLAWGLAALGATGSCIPERLSVGAEPDAGRSCPDGGCLQIFAADQPTPQGVVVTGALVHWTTTSEVRSCDTSGCDGGARTLAGGQGGPWSIAASKTHVCWTNADSGEVMACAASGCDAGPSVVASAQVTPRGIAASEVNYFWTSPDWGAVLRDDVSSAPQWIATNQERPTSVLFWDEQLVWVNEGDDLQAATGMVQHCSVGAAAICKPEPYAKNLRHPSGIAMDATRVYWTELGANASDGTVSHRMRGDPGSAAVVLAAQQAEPFAMVVDGARAYWTNRAGGQVMACAIGGCAGQPTVLAEGLSGPSGIAQDTEALYVAETGASRVLKIVKGW
ncbi:MAG: hypothetical protein HY898_10295 [Deltaproteobacteria bacterium]|nr:hypothetical protein [Deltaproteobacteria bacterium]